MRYKGYTFKTKYNRKKAVRASVGKHTRAEWLALCEQHGNRCIRCGRENYGTGRHQLTRDHIIPISRGGTDDISNIQPLCRSCNSKKWRKSTRY